MKKIDSSILLGKNRVFFRFYGGWNFDERKSTPMAIGLNKSIDGPMKLSRKFTSDPESNYIVKLELAVSGLALPSSTLYGTYQPNRPLRSPINIKKNSLDLRCGDRSSCDLYCIEDFVDNQKCPNRQCSIEFDDILYTSEQKQVDTLIIADIAVIIFEKKYKSLVIVSSDTDMWPGALLCLSQGAKVQIIPTKTRITSFPFLNRTQKDNLITSYAFKG